VGLYTRDQANFALAERWDGVRWSIQATPVPVGAQSSELLAVSCSSITACTAVGDYTNRAGATVTLIEHWSASG